MAFKIFLSGLMSCVFQKTSLIKLSPRYFEMDIVVDKKLVCPILSIAVCFDSLLDVNSVLWSYLRPSPCLVLLPLLWPLSYYWMCGHVLSDSIVALRAHSWVRLEKTSLSQEPAYFLLTRWGASSQTVRFHFGSSLMALCPVSKVCGLLSNRISVPI